VTALEFGVRWAYPSGESFERCGYTQAGAAQIVAASSGASTRHVSPRAVAVVVREVGEWREYKGGSE